MPHSYNLDEENNILEISKRDEFWKFTSHEKYFIQPLEEKLLEEKELELEELENEYKNKKENKENYFSKITSNHIYWFLRIILFSLILFKGLNPSNANLIKTWPFPNQIDILTQNLNNNNLKKSEILLDRKKLLDQLNEIDLKINTINSDNSEILKNINTLTK